MTRIHEAVQRSLPDAPGQPIGDEAAADLQRDIEAATSYLIANCKLPEAADAALHGLLIDLLRGAEALSEADQREQACNASSRRWSATRSCSPSRSGVTVSSPACADPTPRRHDLLARP